MGVLIVIDDQPGRVFGGEEVRLLELLAPQVAVCIRNARLYKELEERMAAQKLAERKLIHAARLAALGELAAGVAHELNNPLTTVTGFVELALDELPNDLTQRAELQIVLDEARRARGVVRRLLDFSRQSDHSRQSTDLNDLVRDVLALVQHQAQAAQVQIKFSAIGELIRVNVDPNQIKQVLLNLVQNGLQAMPNGGLLTLVTSLEHEVGPGGTDWALVRVSDTGNGIQPEYLEKIFEPFFTTRQVGDGTGLGLSVSYGIITDHGGRIEVESQPGAGSCFTVWLPAHFEGQNA